MIRRDDRHFARIFTLPLGLALIAVACGSKDKPPQGGASLGAPATISVNAGSSATPALLEELAAIPRGPKHERRRKGANCACANWVTIQSVGETRDIDPDDGPMPARLVAYIENQDAARTTEKPKFKPKTQAVYYVQVSRDASTSRAKWRLLEFPAAGGGPILAVDSGWVNGCTGHPLASEADADFKACDGQHLTDSTGFVASGAPLRPGLLRAKALTWSVFNGFTKPNAFLLPEDPTWISCNAGCCTLTSMLT